MRGVDRVDQVQWKDLFFFSCRHATLYTMHYGSWEPSGRFLDYCKFLFSFVQSSCAGIKIQLLKKISWSRFWKKSKINNFTSHFAHKIHRAGKKYFLEPFLKKNPKLTVLHLILHTKLTEQVKSIFWQHIWIPDVISFHLIGRTICFYNKIKFSFF